METEDLIDLPASSNSGCNCEPSDTDSQPSKSDVNEDKVNEEISGTAKIDAGNGDSEPFLAADMDGELIGSSSVLQASVELNETVAVVEDVKCFTPGIQTENGSITVQDGSPVCNRKRDGIPITNHEIDDSSTSGVKKARLTVDEQQSSVHVTYNSLTRDSKQKLEELLQQWSEWHARHCSSSHDSNEMLESGAEMYFPALRVGLENHTAVSFWMDNQTRNQQSGEFIALDSKSVPLYDRGYSLEGLISSTGSLMEKPNQNQIQTLKCPRCDSSNTKFCYYNNYSLSQPRHFCKACKRYWTRGGTLRNVPVGGGCRRNKRIKRPISAVDPPPSSSTPPATSNPNIQPHIDISSSSSLINPLFYGLPTNPSELSLPYPSFNSRVSNVDAVSGFDLDPQFSALGLGFSTGLIGSEVQNDDYRNGFNPSSYSIFGSSSTSTSPTIASLLASSLQRQKFFSSGSKDFQEANSFHGLVPYQGEVKIEGGQNRLGWNVYCQNQMEHISPSDPSLYWNASSVGTWLDQENIGPSVPSLI